MGLLSSLFKGDVKLEAAAVSDPAHIAPGAKGAHVGKIQQALIKLDSAGISADSDYGPATAAAVAAFKQKRQILNFAGKIDNIVGKKTIARLDSELLAKEGGGGLSELLNIKPGVYRVRGELPIVIVPSFQPSEIARAGVASNSGGAGRRFGVNTIGTPSLQTLKPIVVVPFNEPASNSFILCESVDIPGGPDGTKNDLNTTNPPQPELKPAEKAAINQARLAFSDELALTLIPDNRTVVQRMEAEAMFETTKACGPEGIDLMSTFFRNTARDPGKTFQVGTSFSNRVRNSKGFATELNGVTKDITEAVQAQFLTGTIDYTKMRGIRRGLPGKPQAKLSNPNGVKGIVEVGYDLSEPDMVALVGSFQATTLFLTSFDVDLSTFTFRAGLRFLLLDHFGIDNSDVVFDFKGHGFPGQRACWLLQHEHGPTHTPFIYRVIVEVDITGSVLDPKVFTISQEEAEFLEFLRNNLPQ